MPDPNAPALPSLIGAWRRAEPAPACAARYPARWRLGADGLYQGEAAEPGAFTWWDSGTWRLDEDGTLRLSVANDAVEPYRCRAVEPDTLEIRDAAGCTVRYERAR